MFKKYSPRTGKRRKPYSFKLSDETISQIDGMADSAYTTKAGALEIMVAFAHSNRKRLISKMRKKHEKPRTGE